MTNNNNEKETISWAFSCEDGLKGLKDPKSTIIKSLKDSSKGSLKSFF